MATTSSVWVTQADDPEQAHLAHPETGKALCAVDHEVEVGDLWSGEPLPEQRCGDCELREMARQGLIRIKGTRQGTLAAF